MTKNVKLLIEYDGTRYSGWQLQKNQNNITVQGTIQQCINNIVDENISLIGCSRTDAGVHAKGFVANFFTKSTIPSERFKYAINNVLPDDIVILDSKQANMDFHSRYSCIGKRYVYKILNRPISSPISRNYAYHFKYDLNLKSMNEACKYIIGKHDFASFRKLGSSVKTTIRTVNKLNVVKTDDFINIDISADGFLYNMVRIIVGTLFDVGIGKKQPRDIINILESKNNQNAGKSVPPMGLYLKEVFY